jgi:putative flippase GtrA
MKRSFWRYVLVGLLGAVAHLSTLSILVERFGVNPIAGSVAGFLVALTLSYWLNSRWSFNQSPQQHRQAIIRYTCVSLLGLGFNTLIMFCLVQQVGMWYFLGQAIAAVIVPLHNFLLNFYWTFKRNKSQVPTR